MKIIISVIVAVMIFCVAEIRLSAAPVIVAGGSTNDYESWIARLDDGRIMLVFDRNPDWESGDLYVAFSSDNGASWTTPVAVIADAGDQGTISFVQLPDNTLKLFYASNETGDYRIHSAVSSDGLSWTREGALNLGWAAGTDWFDPTVIQEADGSFTMSYTVSGAGVYVAHKPAAGVWDTDKTNVSSSGYRARIMKHTDGTYLYAYHKRTGTALEYDIFITTSTNLTDWTSPVQLTTNKNSHDPFANQMPDGSYMVYYAKYESGSYKLHRRSSDDAVTWDPEEDITGSPTSDTQPHFFCESEWLYLVWAHAVDYPDNHDVYFAPFWLPPEAVCGDVNGGGQVNILDIIYLIDYKFKGGPAPVEMNTADVNSDGSINILDIIYLIDFKFKGGPEPHCP